MVVYVVKVTRYLDGTDSDIVDIFGIYSNLALAGRAVVTIVDDAYANGDFLTYECFEKPWGYFFPLYVFEDGDKWEYGDVEIGRVTLDE